MRPIRLEFSGLHSYRTRQIINFEELGAAGLFGIFGPTGSGKSSILDAMTLALYGNVERAAWGTRGIINQNENYLEVSFEFELGSNRYVVERRYQKDPSDPDRARAKYARLWKISYSGDVEEVVASGVSDTNAALERLLGLKQDEFSRAVVLPQGKFDQFLKLTGSERARMLEHIFCLERFGEELTNKARKVSIDCAAQLDNIEAEKRGLGDCSAEAEVAAKQRLAENEKWLQQLEVQYDVLDKRYREAEQLCELYEEKAKMILQKRELDEQKKGMENILHTLNRAEKVEPMRNLMEREKEISEELRLLEEKLAQEKRRLAQTKVELTEAEEALAAATRRKEEELPELIKRQERLQEALAKGAELEKLQTEKERIALELEELRNRLGQLKKARENQYKRLEMINKSYRKLNEQRQKLYVNLAEKEKIRVALQVLAQLESREKLFYEARDEYRERQKKSEKCWQQLVQKIREVLPKTVLEPSTDIAALASEQVRAAERNLTETDKAYQRALVQDRVKVLAQELKEGEPCPVCGSREHPAPAIEPAIELEQAQQALKDAGTRLQMLRRWQENVLQMWTSWQSAWEETKRSKERVEKLAKELEAAQQEFNEVRGDYERSYLQKRYRELERLEGELFEINKRNGAIDEERQEVEAQIRELEGEIQSMELKSVALENQLEGLTAQIKQLVRRLDETTGGIDPEKSLRETIKKIEALQQELKLAEERVRKIRDCYRQLESKVLIVNSKIETLQGEVSDIRYRLEKGITAAGFASIEEARAAMLDGEKREELRKRLESYRVEYETVNAQLKRLELAISGRAFNREEFENLKVKIKEIADELKQAREAVAVSREKLKELMQKKKRWNELEEQAAKIKQRKSLAEELSKLLQGRRFVQFLAEEHLKDMTVDASIRLGKLTGQRYALELGEGCEFVMRDDYNGGRRRPVTSLSGGETFLTSLALALALSSKIQLRGQYPLGFFFLDEGFGTLDEEKLELVVSTLEKLHNPERVVGVISHVRELRERLPLYLEVLPATEDGKGSEVRMVKN
ncbi:SbcC/MukB-like Walker B domain-containing protein [Calderihabitans maritimus]|uniref:Nuclease SbcCD subunit C n=1 Tax=Calderihabitans maritimus TaxID=1246530 RepID=A0A1Z5HY93_9FIRM|nr:SMC family ATPase [Calderihabitans maritimus]GAW94337.1 chromosome segregation protein SMC [Calderihabitans maritimus]